MANQRNAKKKTIAAKIAELTHTSKRTAIKDFNILATIIDDKTIAEMNLSEQEIEYFYEKKQELKNQLLATINKN
jgi:predicted DNA-binding transcriptional regulator YafY